jgi:hypothetical protein
MLLLFISGCSFTSQRVSLRGNCKIIQLNHTAILRVSREDIAPKTGYTPNPGYHSHSPATCFILELVGEPADESLESIHANYRYNSENTQTLVVTWLGRNQAVLYPSSIVGANPITRPDSRDNLKYGEYKLDISYRLGEQDYKCSFDAHYSYNTVFEYHDFRELRDVN